MKIKQINIMLENTPGIIYEVSDMLAKEKINIHALNLSEAASGLGELKLITSDTKKARKIIMEKNLVAKIEEVVAVKTQDIPGGLSGMLKKLFENHINIEYMYAFSIGNNEAVTVFRFNDNEKAEKILKDNNIKSVSIDN